MDAKPRVKRPFPGIVGAVLLLVAATAAQLGVALLAYRLIGDQPLVFVVGAVNLVVLGAASAAGYLISGEAPSWGKGAPARRGFPVAILLTAAGGAVVLGYVADVISELIPLPPSLMALLKQIMDGPVAASLFSLVLVAPLTEELLFRGLLLRGFSRRYGVRGGLLLSSALFALFHLNLIQALPAFAAGLYLGWLYRATGTLWWPMAGHGLFNGCSLLLSVMFPDAGSVPNASPTPWPLIAAGAVVLALGLGLTKRWAPLSPPSVSDTVAP